MVKINEFAIERWEKQMAATKGQGMILCKNATNNFKGMTEQLKYSRTTTL